MGWGLENFYNNFDIRNVYFYYRKDFCKIFFFFLNYDYKLLYNDLKVRKRLYENLK